MADKSALFCRGIYNCPSTFLKKTLHSPVNTFDLCWKSSMYIHTCTGPFLDSPLFPTDRWGCLCASSVLYWLSHLSRKSWSQYCNTLCTLASLCNSLVWVWLASIGPTLVPKTGPFPLTVFTDSDIRGTDWRIHSPYSSSFPPPSVAGRPPTRETALVCARVWYYCSRS